VTFSTCVPASPRPPPGLADNAGAPIPPEAALPRLRALLARPDVAASGVVPRFQVNLLKDPDTLLPLQGGQRAYVEVT